MRKAWTLAVGAGIAGLAATCSPQIRQRPVIGPGSTSGDPAVSALVQSDNAFGFKLFRLVDRAETHRNLCVSPISAALALQMTYNGAAGTTQKEMQTTLALAGRSPKVVSKGNAELVTELAKADPTVALKVANSIWVDKSGALPPKPEFVRRAREDYRATVGNLIGAPETINAWVRKATNDKIASILNKSEMANAVAVLVNAVYFKGAWTTPFQQSATRNAVFHKLDGTRSDVKMMHTTGAFSYLKGDGFEAVRLPYGRGEFSMMLFLPEEGRFAEFLTKLTSQNWREWRSQLRAGAGHLGLPHFHTEFTLPLERVLADLGMPNAFIGGRANFSNLAGLPGEIYIGLARQKTYIDVNEEGTEAAAATVIVMTRGARRVLQQFDLTFDRPFVYAIQDERSGAVLFLGTMLDPAITTPNVTLSTLSR
jgi:serpin B